VQSRFACLIGPTAAGKSAVALALAESCGAEIVSLDSMQVYCGMDIGTAKATLDERARVAHHMLDLVAPSELYDVRRYLTEVQPVFEDIARRGKRALVVGGTALYLKSLVAGMFDGPPVDRALRAAIEERARASGNETLHRELSHVDPSSAARIHVNDTKRLVRALEVFEQTGRSISAWQQQWGAAETPAAPIAGLEIDVPSLDRRIADRTRRMILAGWPEEAARVRASGGFGRSAIQALGYREVLDLADGRTDLEACARAVSLRTRQFARRQRTWYRKFTSARWFPAVDDGGDGGDERDEGRAVEKLARAIAESFGWA
jgi:tRNA dimethylallyltransferase